MSTPWAGIRRLFRLDRGKADVERGVNEELEFHFAQAVDALMATGRTAEEARWEAEHRFGDLATTRQRLLQIDRERAGADARVEWWSDLRQDLRYAFRGMRRNPGFVAAVVLTLGLGIGANATMFGIVDRILFRPPTYLHAPDRVHRVWLMRTIDGKSRPTANIAYTRYLDIARESRQVEAVAAMDNARLAVGLGDASHEESVRPISASFWGFFDIQPALGRFFTAAEDTTPVGATVAVLDWGYWQRQYAGQSDVLGKTIHIGQVAYTIIGVAPRGFQGAGLDQPVAYLPITTYASLEMGWVLQSRLPERTYFNSYNWNWMEMLVRSKPGVTAQALTADLTHAYQLSYALQAQQSPTLTPAAEAKPHVLAGPVQRERGPDQSDESKVALWLVGVSMIVLLIACANVGNLLLARALRRRREIAVRLALGISGRRLLAQMLTESVLLALLGGVTAVLISQYGGGILRATLIPNVEWGNNLADRRIMLFTALVALVAGLLAGFAPAWQASHANVSSSLKAGAREGTHQRSPLRITLLLLQGALSVVLLMGAGLFVRSFHQVRGLKLGYDASHMVLVNTEMRGEKLDSSRSGQLHADLLRAARGLPGVSHAASNLSVPFWSTWSMDLFVAGIDSVNKLGEFNLQAVSDDYFATTGTRILRGRPITDQDRAGGAPVMVVSASMARVLWPGKDALTECVKVDSIGAPCRAVVGIAEDIKAGSLRDDPGLMYYLPLSQYPTRDAGLYLRTVQPANAASAEAIRRGLLRLMPGASYVSVRPFDDILHPEMRAWELGATMFTLFGILALLVAVVGLYSVMAFNVVQRGHEMGVRVALGAGHRDILRLILGEAVGLVAVAVLIGSAIALLAGRWLKPLLFQTSPYDPVILFGVALTMLVVSVLASAAPALRAARTDPNVTLRSE